MPFSARSWPSTRCNAGSAPRASSSRRPPSTTPGGPRAAPRPRPARRSPARFRATSAAAGPTTTSIAPSPTPAAASTMATPRRSPRVEARQKVTGEAVYTVDIRHEGQLDGAVLRSPHARARIVAIDLEPARAIPGVAAAVSVADDDRMVHFVGEAVAAVAAVDRKTALAALAAIKVDYEILPSVIGPDAARKAEAPILFPKGKGQRYNAGEGAAAPASWSGNVRGPTAAFSLKKKSARGSIAGARAAGDPLLFEGTFRTGVQQHTCLEPHAAVARFDGDELTVHASTQAVAELKNQDREVVQARSRKGSGRGRAHRRRLRLQGHAWRRDGHRDQACPGGQGAGQGRLRPARGTVGGGLPAGGGGQGRDFAGTRRSSQGAVADLPFRRGRRGEFDRRRTRASRSTGPTPRSSSTTTSSATCRPAAPFAARAARRWPLRSNRRSTRRR